MSSTGNLSQREYSYSAVPFAHCGPYSRDLIDSLPMSPWLPIKTAQQATPLSKVDAAKARKAELRKKRHQSTKIIQLDVALPKAQTIKRILTDAQRARKSECERMRKKAMRVNPESDVCKSAPLNSTMAAR